METPSREKPVLIAVICLLSVYCGFLTLGLYRVQSKVNEQTEQYQSISQATDTKVANVMTYLEKNHGDDDSDHKDLERLKILLAEHEQKLFLLQDTMNQLFTVSE